MSRKAPRYVSGVSNAESPPCLSMAGDNHVPSAADSSSPERFASSSDDLQRQILKSSNKSRLFPLLRSRLGRVWLGIACL